MRVQNRAKLYLYYRDRLLYINYQITLACSPQVYTMFPSFILGALLSGIVFPALAGSADLTRDELAADANLKRGLANRSTPPTASITAHYLYHCGNDKAAVIQTFDVDVSWVKDHMHFQPIANIDGFYASGTEAPYEGHVGFYKDSCYPVGPDTRCTRFFSGTFRATYDPVTNTVDASAATEPKHNWTPALVRRECMTFSHGSKACPILGRPDDRCDLRSINTTAR